MRTFACCRTHGIGELAARRWAVCWRFMRGFAIRSCLGRWQRFRRQCGGIAVGFTGLRPKLTFIRTLEFGWILARAKDRALCLVWKDFEMCFTGRVGRLTGICILKLSRAANTTRKLGLGAWGDFCNICFRLRRGLYNPRDRARFLNVGPALYAGPGNLQVHGEVAAPCSST